MQPKTVVTFSHFQQALTTCDQYNWWGVKMLFILGFFGLLRVSNLAIGVGTILDQTRHTLVCDCQDKDSSLVINIKWSKANQLGTDVISLPTTKSPLYCPVQNWRLYIASLPPHVFHAGGPIIVHIQDNQVFWPSTDDLRESHRFIWDQAGLTAAAYTPHSLRRGVRRFSPKVEFPWKTSSGWGCGGRTPLSFTWRN